MKVILLVFVSILLAGCSNAPLVNEDITLSGIVLGSDCEGVGKCVDTGYFLYPMGIAFDRADWEEVKPFLNKTVAVTGDLTSTVNLFSCEADYFDGMQHEVNYVCEGLEDVSYYETHTYFHVKEIRAD